MSENQRTLPLLGHLDEMRSRLIKASVAILVCTVVAFVFRNWIYDVLVAPYEAATDNRDLAFFRPTEAFNLFMKLSLFGGLIMAAPFVTWQVWAFVAPALSPKEKRYVVPAVSSLGFLFIVGALLGYWSLDRGLGFLLDFSGDRLEPIIGGTEYMSFAMRFIVVFGLAFEFPVFLFAAAATGLVRSRALRRGRRWAIVIILVIGAIITPSGDPVTLLLLSTPLYLLYEITILLVRFVLKR